jgi:hypothetical protein
MNLGRNIIFRLLLLLLMLFLLLLLAVLLQNVAAQLVMLPLRLLCGILKRARGGSGSGASRQFRPRDPQVPKCVSGFRLT